MPKIIISFLALAACLLAGGCSVFPTVDTPSPPLDTASNETELGNEEPISSMPLASEMTQQPLIISPLMTVVQRLSRRRPLKTNTDDVMFLLDAIKYGMILTQ